MWKNITIPSGTTAGGQYCEAGYFAMPLSFDHLKYYCARHILDLPWSATRNHFKSLHL